MLRFAPNAARRWQRLLCLVLQLRLSLPGKSVAG